MNLSDFDFLLPEELIAQKPADKRTGSRLLKVQKEAPVSFVDSQFEHIGDALKAGDLLVFNNTQVIKARLFGRKESGGKLELFIERVESERQAWCMLKASKAPKAGANIVVCDERDSTNEPVASAVLLERNENLFLLEFDYADGLYALLDKYGELPLPPYIERQQGHTDDDLARYQTVFSKVPGAVAAPTAGLHFDEAIIAQLHAKGVQSTELTLHVGAGTFLPVRTDDLSEHTMHSERIFISDDTIEKIKQTKAQGGRVVAVGTTAVRVLELVAAHFGSLDAMSAYAGETDIFIYPGFEFKVVDALLTNFHLPKSTLLMLVSALSSRETMLAAYEHAIEKRYRFFSYGDAMLII